MTDRKPNIVIRKGRWQEQLANEHCDILLTDPPYTAKTRMGYRSGSEVRAGNPSKKRVREHRKFTITYDAITIGDAWDIARWTVGHVNKYAIIFNDHIGWRWIADALTELGWYVFPPVVWHRIAGPPRFQKDGPPDECEYIVVARPRGTRKLPKSIKGFYETKIVSQGAERCCTEGEGIVGQKPLSLIKAFLRDYAQRGDKVIDLFGGSGTTLHACGEMGLDCISAEIDEKHLSIIDERLARGFTQDALAWLDDGMPVVKGEQDDLFAGMSPASNEAPEGAGDDDDREKAAVAGDDEQRRHHGEDRQPAPGPVAQHRGPEHGCGEAAGAPHHREAQAEQDPHDDHVDGRDEGQAGACQA